MARRSEWDEPWRQLVAVLRQYRESGGLTLAEAQQLFDAAPDVRLPQAFLHAVLDAGRSAAVGRRLRRLPVTSLATGYPVPPRWCRLPRA